jgi:hypothetical protein
MSGEIKLVPYYDNLLPCTEGSGFLNYNILFFNILCVRDAVIGLEDMTNFKVTSL